MMEVLTELTGSILTVTINRPERLNALNKATITLLGAAFSQAEQDEQVRVVLLTGSGEKAFVAGADIKEFADFDPVQGQQLSQKGQAELFDLVANMTTPVIAVINGYALGGGLELALACHMRLLSSTAKVGLPEVTLGLIPGYGGTQRLATIAGTGKAFEMITSAKMIGSQEALECGIVNAVHAPDELLDAAQSLATSISKNSPTAVKAAVKAITASNGPQGFEVEMELFGSLFGTADFKEGVAAFLEKRKPNF